MAIKQLNTTISQSPEGKSIAKIREIRGNTLVWNQRLNLASATQHQITLTNNNDGSYTLNGTSDGTADFYITMENRIGKIGDIVVACYSDFIQNQVYMWASPTGSVYGTGMTRFTVTSGSIDIIVPSGVTLNKKLVYFCVTNLTQMFGSGNEPTIDEFKAMFPNPYSSYSEGALINIGGQTTLTWNQLLYAPSAAQTNTEGGVTYTFNCDGSIKVNGTCSALPGNSLFRWGDTGLINEHYYYCNSGHSDLMLQRTNTGGHTIVSGYSTSRSIIKATSTAWPYFKISPTATGKSYNNVVVHPILIDLTALFGKGNEPTSVDAFETQFPEYRFYVNGEKITYNINSYIESVGFNQWDEEWENGSYGTDGVKNVTNDIRCKNFIEIIGGKTYYFKTPVQFRILTYRADKSLIGIISGGGNNNSVLFTSEVKYIKICTINGSTSTYNNNVCINISNIDKNGTYEPYKKSILPLNISTLTGKLNGEGESVTIVPDGLKSAGTAYDYGVVEDGYLTKIVKRLGSVDLSTLVWTKTTESRLNVGFIYTSSGISKMKNSTLCRVCTKYEMLQDFGVTEIVNHGGASKDKAMFAASSTCAYIIDSTYSDATTFTTAMNGVLMYYELATPETYVLDAPVYVGYEVDTTEKIAPSNILQAPLIADIDYFDDAIKHIQFDDEKHCIRDERILGVDSEPTESSSNVITSGGVYDAIRNKKPLYTKTYTYKCAAATEAEGYIYFMNMTPTSNEWATPWTVHYTLTVDCDTSEDANAKYCHGDYDVFIGCAGGTYYYHIFNKFYSSSYYPIYYHKLIYHNTEAKYNSYRDSHPAKAGVRVLSAWGSNTRTRKYTIKVYDYKNCVISFPDNIENHTTAYSSTYNSVVDFNATSIGLQESSDSNTPNYYNYEYYIGYRIHGTDTPLYRYKFVGFDNRNRIVPINITNQTDSTIVNKTACSVPMTVSNGLALYNTTTAITDASTAVATGTIYRDTSVVSGILQYNLSESVGRSSNSTTSRDIYLVGTYDVNTDEFTLDASSYTSFYKVVAILQSESDYYANFTNGKYYWYLGQCPTSDNIFNFQQHHPLFYFNGTKLIEVKSKAISEKEDKSNKTTSLSASSTDTQYPSAAAVVSYVGNYVDTALTSALKYKGTVASNSALPATHEVGWVYVVSTAGTFAGKACEVGDYIICKTAGTSANNAHWDVINGENQVENKSASLAAAGSSATIATVDGTNLTVTTPSTWTGVAKTGTVTSVTLSATSPIVIDNSAAITTSGSRTFSHATSGVTAGTYKSVTVNATGHVTGGTNPTTVAGYGITDAVTSIGTSGNTLTWAKAGTAQTAITIPYATNADTVDSKHASDFELVTNKITSLSSSATDTQYPSAKLVYDQLSKKSDFITGAWCAGTGAYWGKIFEYAYSGTSTVDNTATFLLTEYGTNSKGYSALLMIDVRGNSKTSISNIKANWIYRTSNTIQNVVKVTHYYENNTFYIRIYAYSYGWSLAVAGTLLQERAWSAHPKFWSGFRATYTGNNVEAFSEIPTDETEVTIENKILTAAGFKTPSGTSSQFLKADGSIDSNTYLTSHQSLSNYVKLDPGAAEQTIKSGISSVNKGIINLYRTGGDYYTFLGFSNGSTEKYLGGIGFKSQADHELYLKAATSSNTPSTNYYKIWNENNHPAPGVTAGTAGSSTASSGSTIDVPYVTVNASGHVTGYGTHTHTISGFSTTDTKATQTKTTSSNTSYRPLLVGYSYSDANPFNPSTVTNTTYATHLAAFAPSTGILKLVGLKKINTSGSDVTGSNTTVWNTNGGTTDISGYLKLVSTTYADLVTLRSNSGLVTGCKYRITDYTTTTSDAESRSAGHQFDIIVTALTSNKLSEEAQACLHSGDTYFANTNFNAWKVWYCLDNDTSRFSWANTSTGKGVIYRLIDERNNDVPYDFKNIQFKRYKVTANSSYSDLSILNNLYVGLKDTLSKGLNITTSDFKWFYTFSKLGSTWSVDSVDDSVSGTSGNNIIGTPIYGTGTKYLNNVVFANGPIISTFRKSIVSTIEDDYLLESTVCLNCNFGMASVNISHFGPSANSYFQSQYRQNIVVGSCGRHNTAESDVQDNTIVCIKDFSFNNIKADFSQNVVYGTSIYDNVFNFDFYNNLLFGAFDIVHNHFKDSFKNNTIHTTNHFSENVFDDYFNTNTVYGTVQACRFLRNVNNNTFGSSSVNVSMYGSSFGVAFTSNTLYGTFNHDDFKGTILSNAFGTTSVPMDMQTCEIGANFKNNNLTGTITGMRTLGQITYCNFNGIIKFCDFYGILQYVTIPTGDSSNQFAYCDIKGAIRGTSSAYIVLDSADFRLSALSGVKRRVTITGETEGKVIATWVENNKTVGIYKETGNTSWLCLSMDNVGQVNPNSLPQKKSEEDFQVQLPSQYLNTSNALAATANPISLTKLYYVECNKDLYVDAYCPSNTASAPVAFRGIGSNPQLYKYYDYGHPGTAMKRQCVRLDSSSTSDHAGLYLFNSAANPARLHRPIRILFLASSWHVCTMFYLNKMFANANMVADIHGYYMGHSQFIEWTKLYNNDLSPLTDASEANRDARSYTSINGADWTYGIVYDGFTSQSSNLTYQQFRDNFYADITAGDWDYICIQQGANQAPYWEYWANYKDLISIVRKHCKKDTIIAFNATWAPAIDNYRLDNFGGRNAEGQRRWQYANNECTKRFIAESGIDVVAPNGAMLWAMRKNSSLNVSGVNDLTSDGIHPRHGVAMYGLSGCWWETFVAPVYGVSFDELTWTPDSNTQKINFNGTSFQAISSSQLEIIRKCVKLAQSDRFGFRTV